VEIIL